MSKQIQQVSLSLIDDPHTPMRSGMDEEKLQELERSIKRHGLMQPIVLRKIGERYEIIAGHRRFLAMRRMKAALIDAVIDEATDAQADERRMAENLYREDINPVDEARYIRKMVEEHSVEPHQLAEMTGKSEVYLQARYELLDYPAYILEALEREQIGLGAAQWLAKIEDDRVRRDYVRFGILGGLTAVRARAWYESWRAGHVPTVAGQIVVPDRTAAGEPLPIFDVCAFCRHRDDISNMSMHYGHDVCVRAVAEAITAPRETVPENAAA